MIILTIAVNAKNNCPRNPKHYQELNCEPIIKPGDDCPSSFKCPDFKAIIEPGKCFVNGKYYNVGEDLPDNETHPCQVNCRCTS